MAEPESIRVVQGTAQPWVWSGWTGWWRRELRDRYQRRRARIRLQEVTDLSDLNWRLRPPGPAGQPDITAHAAFYTPNQIRHIIRWEAGLGSPGVPTPPPGWPREPGRSWRPWPDVTHIKLESHPTVSGVSRDAPTGWWEGAGRGLPLGAALLAAILLLLRAADRCLHTNLFKLPIRRRQSEEWPTPNVMATSLAVRMTNEFSSTRPPSPSGQCTEQVDLPPPYSECTTDGTPTDNRQKPDNEEPPPPYSACYVAYSNPKDGPPSVQFFTSQCQNLFANYEAGPSNVHDTGQNIQRDIINPNSEEIADGVSSEGDTITEDREESDGDEIVSNEANVENAVDSEVEIKENASLTRDRYLVV